MTIHVGSRTLIALGAVLLVAAGSVAGGLIAPSQVVWLGLLPDLPAGDVFDDAGHARR